MVVEDLVLDRTYAALADPTRRALLVALRDGEARITDLAAPLPMTFAGVSRHIGVLETAGLVKREVRGRGHGGRPRRARRRLRGRGRGEQPWCGPGRAGALAGGLDRGGGPR